MDSPRNVLDEIHADQASGELCEYREEITDAMRKIVAAIPSHLEPQQKCRALDMARLLVFGHLN